MKSSVAAAAVAGLAAATAVEASVERAPFVPTTIKAPFVEQFTPDWRERWTPSAATKEQSNGEVFSYVGQWSVEPATVFPGLEGDDGLVAKTKAAQHAISTLFETPVDPAGKPLVVQYEVKLQKGLDCGGAYLKLLSDSEDGIQAKEFSDKTPYTIMFGPDKCGSTNKVHFIFRHRNPKTGEYEEKHLNGPPNPKISKTTSLYTLIVNPDNTFEIKINDELKKSGNLLEDFTPSVNPPKEIDDPEDKKPADWVDEARIPDPKAVKPDDWDEDAPAMIPDQDAEKPEGWLDDEPATVPDPEANKPEEWDDEEDGEWIAPSVPNPKCEAAPGCGKWTPPMIANPNYKGKWSAPMIDNPAYKGVWKPRKIDNPDYFEDLQPANFNKIGGIGFEIWTMSEDILFDNIYVGHSSEEAKALALETFHAKLPIEQNREDATKAKDVGDGEIPDWKVDPVGFARGHIDGFVKLAVDDPVGAFKEKPETGVALGAAFATLVGMIGVLFSLIASGSSKPTPAKSAKKAEPVSSKQDDSSAKTTATDSKVKDAELKKRGGK